jgi:hypothetical protein
LYVVKLVNIVSVDKVVSKPTISDSGSTAGRLKTTIKNCGLHVTLQNQLLNNKTEQEIHDLFLRNNGRVLNKQLLPYTAMNDLLGDLLLREKEIEMSKAREISEWFHRLQSTNETKIENESRYQQLKKDLLFYDSHTTETVFHLMRYHAESIDCTDYEIEKSAKPDGIHQWFPAYLEIKGETCSHLSGLEQALKRILSSVTCYGYFAKHMVFVQEKYFSFVVYFDEENSERTIQIYLVTIEDLVSLMLMINENLKDKAFATEWLYHSDSSILFKLFHSMNRELFGNERNLSDAQILKHSISSSKIYKIRIGQKRTGKSVIDSIHDPCFVVKINWDIRRYLDEVTALQRINTVYAAMNEEHYSIGYMNGDSNGVCFFGRTNQPSSATVSQETNFVSQSTPRYWFDGYMNIPMKEPTRAYGVIIMHEGKSIEEFTIDVYRDVVQSIRKIHEAKVLHRDIRPNNIMYFPKFQRHFIVDFDLAIAVVENAFSARTTIQRDSGQGKRIPFRYKELFARYSHWNEITVDWSFDDDVLMICEYALSKGIKLVV